MKSSNKMQHFAVLMIVVLVIGLTFFFTNNQKMSLRVEYPQSQTKLADADFSLQVTGGKISVGTSSWDQIKSIYPAGKMLGISTIYRPTEVSCLFTFSKKENRLIKVDISDRAIALSRGIRVNDSFDKVIKQYGTGYIKMSVKSKEGTFDMVYGSKNYIVFKIVGNRVSRMVIDHPLS